jgi:hypothetical protein
MMRTADMKRRGWSEFLIGLLLGWPDAITEQNYSGRLGQTRWYQRRRVIAAEATADFKRGAQPCRPQLYKKPKRPKPGEDPLVKEQRLVKQRHALLNLPQAHATQGRLLLARALRGEV